MRCIDIDGLRDRSSTSDNQEGEEFVHLEPALKSSLHHNQAVQNDDNSPGRSCALAVIAVFALIYLCIVFLHSYKGLDHLLYLKCVHCACRKTKNTRALTSCSWMPAQPRSLSICDAPRMKSICPVSITIACNQTNTKWTVYGRQWLHER